MPPAPPTVTVRYWAGARAAAGVETEQLPAGSVGDVTALAAQRHPGLVPVLRVATYLLDGLAADLATPVPPGSTLEVLPPFAGG